MHVTRKKKWIHRYDLCDTYFEKKVEGILIYNFYFTFGNKIREVV